MPPPASPDSQGSALVDRILEFLQVQDLLDRHDIAAELEREIDRAGVSGVVALKDRLASDNGWAYYPRDPLAQRIHHRLADRFLAPDSQVIGIAHLDTVAGAPLAMFANHLSYADANVIEVLLHRAGCAAVADRLTAVAGPKVFTSRERRFSSLCFGTVKVPQSTEVSSEEAVLDARVVAKAAREAIAAAHARLREGDALLLFAEGTRSRIGAMQRMLPGVARYLEEPCWVLPAGLVGPESLFPVGGSLQPSRVALRCGPPFHSEALTSLVGNRRLAMDAIGLAIARLLPSEYRGEYSSPSVFAEARRILDHLDDRRD